MKSTGRRTAGLGILTDETIRTEALAWALRGCGVFLLGGSVFAQSLVNGGVVRGTISRPGETDTYTFDANHFDWFTLRLVDEEASSFSPQIEVYQPNGSLVQSSTSPDVAVIESTKVFVGGTYTVVVSNASTTRYETGAYALHFVLAPGANEGGELLDGLTVFGEIELGDLDSYTFVVEEGQTVSVTTATLTGLGTLSLRKEFLGPSGGYAMGTGSLGQFTTSTPGLHTMVLSDASDTATGTGRYLIVAHGLSAAPPYPPSVFRLPENLRYGPLLLDNAGNPGLGPRIGEPREPFNVSIDCGLMESPSFYSLSIWTGVQSGLSTPWGLLYTDGQRLLRKSGLHTQSVETWFPPDTGLPLPNDPSLVGISYTVQGICGGGVYLWPARLSSAITQTIGGY